MSNYYISSGQSSSFFLKNRDILYVSAGGTDSGSVLDMGGTEVVFASGLASGTQLFAGGTQDVQGLAVDTLLSGGGGYQQVYSGGQTTSTEVTQGGSETVFSGGSAIDTTAVNGGFLIVGKGATATGAAVYGRESDAGATNSFEAVYGTVTETTVGILGIETVHAGGTAIDTIVHGGLPEYSQDASVAGEQFVFGAASGTTLIGVSATQYVESAGDAFGTSVGSGGLEFVLSGGTASGAKVTSGGFQLVSSGGVATDARANFRGSQIVSFGGTASGTVVNGGGRAVVRSGGTLADATIQGAGAVVLTSGAIDTTPISFVSSGGVVKWGGSGLLGPELSGFAPGDKLDLMALPWTSDGTASMQGTLLTVAEGGQVDQIQFAEGTNFGGKTWQLTSDWQHGTALKLA